MKGRKCSIIFMRKVANRLEVLEERYKDLSPKERAGKINEQMLSEFCVGEREIRQWKRIVNVAKQDTEHMFREPLHPSHYREIAKLPEERQKEAIEEIAEKKLTYLETKELITEKLGKNKPLPVGDFDIVYADPPWQYDVNFLSASPDNHYDTLTVEEICHKKPSTNENAILFLWATNPLLTEALEVLEEWGFKYKTNMVWVKDRIGLGFYFRGQHELLLLGVKGKVTPPIESCRFPSVLKAEVREHSRKPDEVYEIIEKMYPTSNRLELFARNKREGWTAWGNEV
jgi:N6-adenosine-specific RNA methylase IME4